MPRKNVLAVGTNVTPDQFEVIETLCAKMGLEKSHLVRIAISQYVERNNASWPVAEVKHGGYRRPPIIEGEKEST